ncbi:MAG TPA: hypothetical protein VGG72_19770 [Bryobacteraceae bacterium]|jgi:hypothetical protein
MSAKASARTRRGPFIKPAFAAIVLTGVSLHAQWLNFKTPGVPRTADGKPNLSAPAPKMPDGKPDLSGLWNADRGYLVNIAVNLKEVPMRPAGLELFNQRKDGALAKEEPDANCLPQGVPKIDAAPVPWKLIQGRGEVTILYEAFSQFREIFTDGRELPKDPNPTWLGYSVGHWEGDTLVVESSGFNGKTWLDQMGHPASDALHVTERFRRKDFGHLELEITIDDPKMYTKPWTVKENPSLLLDSELLEFNCNENERDIRHMVP